MSHFDILMTITLKVNMIIRQMIPMTRKLALSLGVFPYFKAFKIQF